MLEFIVRRILYGALVLVGVVVIVFFLSYILPGDPARLTLGQRADVASIEAVNRELGLDKPLATQFWMYIGDLSPVWVHHNTPEAREKYNFVSLFETAKNVLALKWPYLRRSYQTQREVSEILLEAVPVTFLLAVTSIILASIIGITLGVISAIRQASLVDNLSIVVAVLGISLPSYFAGIIIQWLFAYKFSDLTGLEMHGGLFVLGIHGETLALKNLVLPSLALGIRPIAIIMQLTRSAMLDVLTEDYVRTAIAKGLSYYSVLFKHALRNALNPVVTAISGWFAALMTGAFFIEIIFDWKGLGYRTVKALQESDFPVVMGAVLLTSLIFIIINILVDIIYAWLDPRVSVKGEA